MQCPPAGCLKWHSSADSWLHRDAQGNWEMIYQSNAIKQPDPAAEKWAGFKNYTCADELVENTRKTMQKW